MPDVCCHESRDACHGFRRPAVRLALVCMACVFGLTAWASPPAQEGHESAAVPATPPPLEAASIDRPRDAVHRGTVYGTLQPVPDNLWRSITATPGENHAASQGGSGVEAYANTEPTILFPPGAGVLIADDIETILREPCTLRSYTIGVSGGGTGDGPGFDITVGLYDACPGAGGSLIAGTDATVMAPDDGNFAVTVDVVGEGIEVPGQFWLGVSFSTSSAGWLVGAPAQAGFTADAYHFPSIPCQALVGGTIYAGFHARVEVEEGCQFWALRQVNVGPVGENIRGDAANEPSLAVDPANPDVIAIGWRQFDTVLDSFRRAGYAYSADGGETWTFPGPLTPSLFRSDPVLDTDAEGTFYYSSLQGNFECDMFTSQDGGATWDSPTYAFGGDKQWITIDRTAGIGAGHIYQAWSLFAGCCGNAVFNRSIDGGATFETPMTVPFSPRWGTLTVDTGGRLFIAGVGASGGIIVVRSSNAQDPLDVPAFELSSVVDLGGEPGIGGDPNPGGLEGQVWIDTDRSGTDRDGHVYVMSSIDPPGADPLDVMIARSTDGGATWEPAVRVNDDQAGAWQWFGTMSVAPNGRIDAVFNDTRHSPDPRFSRVYYTSSIDGGKTWTPNRAFTPTFDSYLGWPQQNKMGDYYDMVSQNEFASLAFAATFNGEQDVYFERLLPDCNGNLIGDAEDITAQTSEDCNANLIPDECEIAAGIVSDSNDNGIPDSCENVLTSPPLAAGTTSCAGEGDCINEAVCLNGVCYVPRNRYLAVQANAANAGLSTARRLTWQAPGNDPVILGWVGQPDVDGVSRVAGAPHYADWSGNGGLTLVADCAISPDGFYLIESIDQSADVGNPSAYSSPLALPTVSRWGDVTGGFSGGLWTPPNGVGNFDDVLAVVQGFQSAPGSAPTSWLDLADPVPNGAINFADIQQVVQGGFQGSPYPYPAPDACP